VSRTEESADVQHSVLVQKFPLFYGWLIMGAGTLGLIMTSPGQTYTVSIFIEHFIEDLGLSPQHVLAVSLLVQLIQSVASLPGGYLWLTNRRASQAPVEPLKESAS
jgi:hypothetical protein